MEEGDSSGGGGVGGIFSVWLVSVSLHRQPGNKHTQATVEA